MAEYGLLVAGFAALAAYLLLVFRAWHGHLTRLAERHDLIARRRKAARHYAFVAILLIVPMVSVVLWGLTELRAAHGSPVVVLLLFLGALAPGIIWGRRRRSQLRALGFGG